MATTNQPKRKNRKLEEVLASGEDWRFTHDIDNDVAKKVLAESKGRDDCDKSKIIVERLRESYKKRPFKKKK